MTSSASNDDIRLLVRKVLRELMPDGVIDSAAAESPRRAPVFESVSIRTDADLEAFVRRVLAMADDPIGLAELRSGRRRFRLEHGAPSSPGAPVSAAARQNEAPVPKPGGEASGGFAQEGAAQSGTVASPSHREEAPSPVRSGASSGARSEHSTGAPGHGAAGVERISNGVVSESQITAIARNHRCVVLGPAAVITPLARDRARQLGLTVEREQ